MSIKTLEGVIFYQLADGHKRLVFTFSKFFDFNHFILPIVSWQIDTFLLDLLTIDTKSKLPFIFFSDFIKDNWNIVPQFIWVYFIRCVIPAEHFLSLVIMSHLFSYSHIYHFLLRNTLLQYNNYTFCIVVRPEGIALDVFCVG